MQEIQTEQTPITPESIPFDAPDTTYPDPVDFTPHNPQPQLAQGKPSTPIDAEWDVVRVTTYVNAVGTLLGGLVLFSPITPLIWGFGFWTIIGIIRKKENARKMGVTLSFLAIAVLLIGFFYSSSDGSLGGALGNMLMKPFIVLFIIWQVVTIKMLTRESVKSYFF